MSEFYKTDLEIKPYLYVQKNTTLLGKYTSLNSKLKELGASFRFVGCIESGGRSLGGQCMDLRGVMVTCLESGGANLVNWC